MSIRSGKAAASLAFSIIGGVRRRRLVSMAATAVATTASMKVCYRKRRDIPGYPWQTRRGLSASPSSDAPPKCCNVPGCIHQNTPQDNHDQHGTQKSNVTDMMKAAKPC